MPEVEENTALEPDWDDIKNVYMASEGDLLVVAGEYGITIPDILLEARKFGWGERGSREEAKSLAHLEAKGTSQQDVLSGHKSASLNLMELLNDSIIQIKNSKGSIKETVNAIKTLSDSLAKIVMIERQAHEIDTAASDSPDSIVINMGGKRVELTCSQPKPDEI
jgi:hypothetical protein